MAIRANRAVMRKLPIGMVERRAEPAGCGVAGGARCGKSRRNVIWHAAAKRLRALPSRDVAAITVGRQIAGVIAVDVAGTARSNRRIRVRAGEREPGGAVVEHSRGPRGNGMARRALRRGGREACGHVIRHRAADRGRTIERCGVTPVAVRGVQRVVVVDMAGSARRGKVRAHQRETRNTVIEGSGVPSCGSVAIRAVGCRECSTSRRVHRIVRGLPGGQVALRVAAIGRSNFQGVIAIDVAGAAGDGGVRVG